MKNKKTVYRFNSFTNA